MEIELVQDWQMRWPRPVCTEPELMVSLNVLAGGFIDFSSWRDAARAPNQGGQGHATLRLWYAWISPYVQTAECTFDMLDLPLSGHMGTQAQKQLERSLWKQVFFAAAKQIEVH